jgi:hypothetical protein
VSTHEYADCDTGRADIRHGSGGETSNLGPSGVGTEGTHHHPQHPLHGGGGLPRRSCGYYGTGQTAVLWQLAVSQEQIRLVFVEMNNTMQHFS